LLGGVCGAAGSGRRFDTHVGEGTLGRMSIEYPISPDVSATPLPFSPATKVGNLIFVSGQASTDAVGNVISDTFENEFRRSIENVRRILRACGSDLDKVARVNAYVKNSSDWEQYNELYREYFKPPYPARTTITNCLGKMLFEIDVIAVCE
jgi:2-iminobutanoate/2-iminopropanoate deaminase